eukprot:3819015-Rhodomonas_salina.1
MQRFSTASYYGYSQVPQGGQGSMREDAEAGKKQDDKDKMHKQWQILTATVGMVFKSLGNKALAVLKRWLC